MLHCVRPLTEPDGKERGDGRVPLHLRDQHVGVARRVESPRGHRDRPGKRARGRVGRGCGSRLRRGLADGRLGAQPGGDRDRARERGPGRELPARPARLPDEGCGRLAVLHPRLHGRCPPRRTGRARGRAGGARRARCRVASRLRAEPRRARPPVDGGAPGVLRARERRGSRAGSGVVRRASATACSRTAATRISPPGPTSCS